MKKDQNMKRIYLCSQGEYSDYGIYGVFDDRHLADAFAKIFDCRVEERPINPYKMELRKGYRPYLVYISRAGKASCRESTVAYPFQQENLWHRVSFARGGDLYLHCIAKDDRHAVKIANEQRSKVIALGMWPKEEECPTHIQKIEQGLAQKGGE